MANRSAGILAYRKNKDHLEVMLVHPGGPFWKNKNHNAWSIPKGLVDEGENELEGAKREFIEETGFTLENKDFLELNEAKQTSGKIIKVWAVEADFETKNLRSNTFKMEWPPKSRKLQEFPEVDKADWFEIEYAKTMIVKGQISILDQLVFELEELQS